MSLFGKISEIVPPTIFSRCCFSEFADISFRYQVSWDYTERKTLARARVDNENTAQ